MKNQNAVIFFARTPEIKRSADGEPFSALPWEDLDAIFHACLGDLVAGAAGIPDVDVIVYRDERFLPAGKFIPPGDNVAIMDLPAGDIEAAAGQAVEHAFLEFYHRLAVVLDNNPVLGPARIARALDLLGTEDDAVVVTPAADGRVAMMALKANHPSVFRPDGRGAGGILGRLCDLDVHLFPTEPVFLVDTPAAIDRLRHDLALADPSGPGFPKLTLGVFRTLEKKYKLKRAGA